MGRKTIPPKTVRDSTSKPTEKSAPELTQQARVNDAGEGLDAGELNGDDPCRRCSGALAGSEQLVVAGADETKNLGEAKA